MDSEQTGGMSVASAGAETSVDDLVEMPTLTDTSLLQNLERRHAEREVYTYAGTRLIVSVNPYDWEVSLPFYSEAVRDAYASSPDALGGGSRSLPPHLYAVAEQAWRQRRAAFRSQALIVGGESGAGKTEAVKIMLRYLCSRGHDGTEKHAPGSGAALVERLVELNPVLEAFGNAATALNHNSSRFGKLISLRVAPASPWRGAAIVGGQISTYLLEKSRLARHAAGETSFHVLYARDRGSLMISARFFMTAGTFAIGTNWWPAPRPQRRTSSRCAARRPAPRRRRRTPSSARRARPTARRAALRHRPPRRAAARRRRWASRRHAPRSSTARTSGGTPRRGPRPCAPPQPSASRSPS